MASSSQTVSVQAHAKNPFHRDSCSQDPAVQAAVKELEKELTWRHRSELLQSLGFVWGAILEPVALEVAASVFEADVEEGDRVIFRALLDACCRFSVSERAAFRGADPTIEPGRVRSLRASARRLGLVAKDRLPLRVSQVLEVASCISNRDADRRSWLTMPIQLLALDGMLSTIVPSFCHSEASTVGVAADSPGLPQFLLQAYDIVFRCSFSQSTRWALAYLESAKLEGKQPNGLYGTFNMFWTRSVSATPALNITMAALLLRYMVLHKDGMTPDAFKDLPDVMIKEAIAAQVSLPQEIVNSTHPHRVWMSPLLWALCVSPMALLCDRPLYEISGDIRVEHFVALRQHSVTLRRPTELLDRGREVMTALMHLAMPEGRVHDYSNVLDGLARGWVERPELDLRTLDQVLAAHIQNVQIVTVCKRGGIFALSDVDRNGVRFARHGQESVAVDNEIFDTDDSTMDVDLPDTMSICPVVTIPSRSLRDAAPSRDVALVANEVMDQENDASRVPTELPPQITVSHGTLIPVAAVLDGIAIVEKFITNNDSEPPLSQLADVVGKTFCVDDWHRALNLAMREDDDPLHAALSTLADIESEFLAGRDVLNRATLRDRLQEDCVQQRGVRIQGQAAMNGLALEDYPNAQQKANVVYAFENNIRSGNMSIPDHDLEIILGSSWRQHEEVELFVDRIMEVAKLCAIDDYTDSGWSDLAVLEQEWICDNCDGNGPITLQDRLLEYRKMTTRRFRDPDSTGSLSQKGYRTQGLTPASAMKGKNTERNDLSHGLSRRSPTSSRPSSEVASAGDVTMVSTEWERKNFKSGLRGPLFFNLNDEHGECWRRTEITPDLDIGNKTSLLRVATGIRQSGGMSVPSSQRKRSTVIKVLAYCAKPDMQHLALSYTLAPKHLRVDEQAMIFFEVTVPRAVVHDCSDLLEFANQDFFEQGEHRRGNWVLYLTHERFSGMTQDEIEDLQATNKVLIVTGGPMVEKWTFSTAYAQRFAPSGIVERRGPMNVDGSMPSSSSIAIKHLVDPADRDESKTVDIKTLPLQTLPIQLMLLEKLDISQMAIRARSSYLKSVATARERDIDYRVLVGTHWGDISQARSFNPPQCGNAGFFTLGRVGCGAKVLYTRTTAVQEDRSEVTISDFRYFKGVSYHDTKRGPGGETWAASVIGVGGQIYLPPNTRYMEYTVLDTLSDGCIGLDATHLDQSFQGFLNATLAGPLNANSEPAALLSIFQSTATFWRLAMDDERRELMDDNHLAVRTAPTSASSLGLVRLVVCTSALVFHAALCMEEEVYDGIYITADIYSAALIVGRLFSEARVVCEGLNTEPSSLHKLQRALELEPNEVTHDRHAAGGLLDVMFHVGRAIVAASRTYASYCEENPHLGLTPHNLQHPDVVYRRVVAGLGSAFHYPDWIVAEVLGPLADCDAAQLKNCNWFPKMRWATREQVSTGVVLWRCVRERARSIEKGVFESQHTQSFVASRPDRGVALRAHSYEEDMDELSMNETLGDDADAEGETDVEYIREMDGRGTKSIDVQASVLQGNTTQTGYKRHRAISASSSSLNEAPTFAVGPSNVHDGPPQKRRRRVSFLRPASSNLITDGDPVLLVRPESSSSQMSL